MPNLPILALGLALLLMFRSRFKVLNRHQLRNDGAGLGHFGAPRGRRTHQGLDLLTTPGEPVFSPVNGRFIRTGKPYADDGRYSLMVIHGTDGREWKLMYVDGLPGLIPGQRITAGRQIGTSQDIAARYGPPMQPHVHVEVRTIVGAHLVDPAPLLNLA